MSLAYSVYVREEQATATRAELLRVARTLFAERGYADVGTEEIVRAAHVTRGALYHHFADKRDLFRAVHEQVADDLLATIAGKIAGITDPWEALETGVRAFLDACTDPAVMRISHLDAPAVLGWAEWREIDARHWLGVVSDGVQEAIDGGASAPPARPAARAHAARRDGRGVHADRQRRGPSGRARRGRGAAAGAAGGPAGLTPGRDRPRAAEWSLLPRGLRAPAVRRSDRRDRCRRTHRARLDHRQCLFAAAGVPLPR